MIICYNIFILGREEKRNENLFNVIVGTEEIRVWKCNDRNKISLIEMN